MEAIGAHAMRKLAAGFGGPASKVINWGSARLSASPALPRVPTGGLRPATAPAPTVNRGMLPAPAGLKFRRGVLPAAGVGGGYLAGNALIAPTDHVAGMNSSMETMQQLKRQQMDNIAALERGENPDMFGFLSTNSKAELAKRLEQEKANLASGNYGNTFGRSFSQYQNDANNAARALQGGNQKVGPLAWMFGGYRNQGGVDSAVATSAPAASTFKDLGVVDPREAAAAATAAKPLPAYNDGQLGALLLQQYREAQDPWRRDWSGLTVPAPR